MIRTFLAAAFLAIALPAEAHDMASMTHGETAIAVSDVWANAAPGSNGAVYAMIMNGGAAADRLIAVKSDLAAAVELHAMSEEGGVMQMRKVDGVDVPAGGMVMLESGGTHIMLIGLKAPLREGTTGTLTFVFEHAGDVSAELTVRAGGSGGHDHH
ncbi:hypothetical protein sos41_04210 [Alphaproteobacteria bacterium SO-S41]|nr:hypothetical protein sos41_04210 [Alphaproteobacteria bacterium SO-S41]